MSAAVAYLLDWAHSRIAQRRTVFGSLHKLMTFLAYADPGSRHRPCDRESAGRPPVTSDPRPSTTTCR
jgi:hypothetical protein